MLSLTLSHNLSIHQVRQRAKDLAKESQQKSQRLLSSLQSSSPSPAGTSLKAKQLAREKRAATLVSPPPRHNKKARSEASSSSAMSPTTELKSLKAEAKTLKSQNDAALLKLRTDNTALAKANDTLSTDLNAATEQRGQAVQANVVLNNTNVDLTSTNKTLESEATDLLKQVEDLTNAGKLLESRITEIEAGAGGNTGDLKRQIAELEKNMDELAVHYGNVSQDHALLSKSDQVLKQANKVLEQANKVLAEKLQAALAELKKEGKSALFEQAKDIAEPLREHVRTEAYREWKFIHNETEVTTFMEECYAAMVKKLPNLGAAEHDDYLTMEDFDRIYRQVAVTKLNSRRQFSQTQMYKAVFSKCQFRSWRQKLLGYIH
jgi:archaellum component FlaC